MRSWLAAVLALAACRERSGVTEPPTTHEPALAGELTQVYPPAGSIVTSHRPRLRWRRPPDSDDARVEICSDRDCARVLQTFDSAGAGAAPPNPLEPGLVYWRVTALSKGTPVGTSRFAWPLRVRQRDVAISTAWSRGLDWNGDGITDLAVNAPEGVRVYLGEHSGLVTAPSVVIASPPGVDGFGTTIAPAGDIDEDGHGDLVVAAPATKSAAASRLDQLRGGVVVIISGHSAGPILTLEEADPEVEYLGATLASFDGNGDTFSDLIVGAPGARHDRVHHGRRVVTYRGARGGYQRSDSWAVADDHPLADALALSAGGDVNGDGYADAIVAMTEEVRVLYGGPDGVREDRGMVFDAKLTGHHPSVVIAPDLDGDGYDDIVVTSLNDVVGGAEVHGGGSGGPSSTPTYSIKAPGGSQSWFGQTVALGDFDGDGSIDLALGSHGKHRIDLYRGQDVIGGAPPWLTITGPIDEWFPAELHAGDFDGDGIDDLVAIGRQDSGSGTREPRIHLYRGSVDGPIVP